MSALLIEDDFDRADANPIGGDWQMVTGENATQIVSQRVRSTVTPGSNSSVFFAPSAVVLGPDQYASIALVRYDATAGVKSGYAMARVSLTARTYYAFGAENNTAGFGAGLNIALNKNVAGVGTNLASISLSISANDLIRLDCQKSVITCTIAGAFAMSATDTSIPSGSVGYSMDYVNAQSDVELDNFTAGDASVIIYDYTDFPKPKIRDQALANRR